MNNTPAAFSIIIIIKSNYAAKSSGPTSPAMCRWDSVSVTALSYRKASCTSSTSNTPAAFRSAIIVLMIQQVFG